MYYYWRNDVTGFTLTVRNFSFSSFDIRGIHMKRESQVKISDSRAAPSPSPSSQLMHA